MNVTTTISRVYAVSTAVGCTVSTAEGVTLLSLPANSQGFFVAPESEVIVSDDEALVTCVP